jgi:uncharacterized damage-inducible protein DinB
MRIAPILAAATLLVAPALLARSMKPNAAAPAPPKNGFRAEFLHDLDDVEKKIMQLAMAMPAAKFSWRPARGVRSVSEVYMHVAGGNYFVAGTIRSRQTAIEPQMIDEQIADKQRVLDELRRSFEQLRSAALNITDADLDKTVRMYGSDTTERGAFMTALTHLHEHLGQSIAYARMNGIAPPWSGM